MPRARLLGLLALLAWVCIALWNALKPLPAGTRVASLAVRLAESQMAVVEGGKDLHGVLARELAAVDRADELIVLDQISLPRELGQRLLTRRRERPNIKIVLVSDPRTEADGGTPREYLDALEKAGVIVARVRLDRLRDSTPLYSALWRVTFAWWSDPFDESSGLRATLRVLNFKADQRQIMVADDGSGGWVSILPASSRGDLALEISGGLARDIAASELQIAAWSSDDDRLPSAPRTEGPRAGSIDARFLTEGAIRGALVDALAAAGAGDEVSMAARALSDRSLIDALLRAAGRGAHLRILLDPGSQPNAAVAGELGREGNGRIEVRWFAPANAAAVPALIIVRHRGEVTVCVGAADLTRPSLGDVNLEAAVELRLSERAAAARTLVLHFDAKWPTATAYARHADESRAAYWRYRVLQSAGLMAY